MSNFLRQLSHPSLDDIQETLDDYDAFRPIGQPMVKPQFSLLSSPQQRIQSALYGQQQNTGQSKQMLNIGDL